MTVLPRLIKLAALRSADIKWVGEPRSARIGQLPLDVLVLIELCEILWRADRRIDKRRAHRRLANLFKLHAVARGGKPLKVLDNFGPARELAVVAGSETENVRRRGNCFGLGERGSAKTNRVGLERQRDEEKRGKRQRQAFIHFVMCSSVSSVVQKTTFTTEDTEKHREEGLNPVQPQPEFVVEGGDVGQTI